MKKIITFLLFLISINLYALDFKTDFSFNNLYFDSDNKINPNSYGFEFSEVVSQEISDGLILDVGFKKSLISDYSIFTDFKIQRDLFGFNLGIFTNFLNDSSKILTPGLNYGVDFKIPGITLLHLKLKNTIPNTTPLEAGTTINNYDIKVGFYLGDAIISANILSESSAKGNILKSESLTSDKYFLNLDLFNKYSKYRINIDLGWNLLTKEITTLNTDGTTVSGSKTGDYQAGSGYFDSDITLLLTDYLTINFGVLLHLIKLPIKNVTSFENDKLYWGGNIGFTLRF